jgi:putative Mn2+ efflux pump MntP
MNKLFDLSFVIGIFFSIIGLLLLVFSFITEVAEEQIINRWCGIVFIVFGIFMILLSFKKDEKGGYSEEENVDTPLSQYGEGQ